MKRVNCKSARQTASHNTVCEDGYFGGKPGVGMCRRCENRTPVDPDKPAVYQIRIEANPKVIRESDWTKIFRWCGTADPETALERLNLFSVSLSTPQRRQQMYRYLKDNPPQFTTVESVCRYCWGMRDWIASQGRGGKSISYEEARQQWGWPITPPPAAPPPLT